MTSDSAITLTEFTAMKQCESAHSHFFLAISLYFRIGLCLASVYSCIKLWMHVGGLESMREE